MKTIMTILSLMLLSSGAFAIDQNSLELLKKQGFQVRMGELTGAGSKMSLVRLAGFIHPQGIVMKADCKSIAVSTTVDPKISDVTKVVVDQSTIAAGEFEGFFTFQ